MLESILDKGNITNDVDAGPVPWAFQNFIFGSGNNCLYSADRAKLKVTTNTSY